jgi:hypothetical protein
MIYKSLFLLVFANMFNQAYQMQNYYLPEMGAGNQRNSAGRGNLVS